MTPESGVLLGLVIAITACGILTCSVCFVCCCVTSVWNMLTNGLWRTFNGGSSSKYQTVNSTSPQQNAYGAQGVAHASAASLTSGEDIPMVEAYVVPPLAAAHGTPTSAATLTLDDNQSTRPPIVPGAKDVWAAVIFIANVIIIFGLAINAVVTFNDKSHPVDYDYGSINFPMLALYLCLILFLISGVGSWLVYVFIRHGESIIDWVMKLNIGGLFLFAVLCLITLQIIPAIVFGIMAGVNMWYYHSARNRIPFASSVLAAACTAVRQNFLALLMTSFAGLIFQGLWMLLWSIAIFGVLLKSDASNNNSNGDDGDNGGTFGLVTFLFALSLYWGLQLIKDVVSVTAGGTVASWWFQPKHPAPVRGALFRATTSSFGSICLGSFILALVTTLRAMVRSAVDKARRSSNRGNRNVLRDCLLMVLEALLRALEGVINYINRYAYSYVAAYGHDFVTSGRAVMQLFERRGWSAIINDDLIGNALWLFSCFLGLAGALTGTLLTFFLFSVHSPLVAAAGSDPTSFYIAGAVYGLIVGVVVGALVTSVLDSAVAMVYVCFAEDSASLQTHHPETFLDLQSKWSLFNPDSLLPAGATLVEEGQYAYNQHQHHQPVHQQYQVQLSPVHQSTGHAAHHPPYNPHFSASDSHGSHHHSSYAPTNADKGYQKGPAAAGSQAPGAVHVPAYGAYAQPAPLPPAHNRPPPMNPSYRGGAPGGGW